MEEVQEARHAAAGDLPGELADVLELLRALAVTAGRFWPQLLALAEDIRCSQTCSYADERSSCRRHPRRTKLLSRRAPWAASPWATLC